MNGPAGRVPHLQRASSQPNVGPAGGDLHARFAADQPQRREQPHVLGGVVALGVGAHEQVQLGEIPAARAPQVIAALAFFGDQAQRGAGGQPGQLPGGRSQPAGASQARGDACGGKEQDGQHPQRPPAADGKILDPSPNRLQRRPDAAPRRPKRRLDPGPAATGASHDQGGQRQQRHQRAESAARHRSITGQHDLAVAHLQRQLVLPGFGLGPGQLRPQRDGLSTLPRPPGGEPGGADVDVGAPRGGVGHDEPDAVGFVAQALDLHARRGDHRQAVVAGDLPDPDAAALEHLLRVGQGRCRIFGQDVAHRPVAHPRGRELARAVGQEVARHPAEVDHRHARAHPGPPQRVAPAPGPGHGHPPQGGTGVLLALGGQPVEHRHLVPGDAGSEHRLGRSVEGAVDAVGLFVCPYPQSAHRPQQQQRQHHPAPQHRPGPQRADATQVGKRQRQQPGHRRQRRQLHQGGVPPRLPVDQGRQVIQQPRLHRQRRQHVGEQQQRGDGRPQQEHLAAGGRCRHGDQSQPDGEPERAGRLVAADQRRAGRAVVQAGEGGREAVLAQAAHRRQHHEGRQRQAHRQRPDGPQGGTGLGGTKRRGQRQRHQPDRHHEHPDRVGQGGQGRQQHAADQARTGDPVQQIAGEAHRQQRQRERQLAVHQPPEHRPVRAAIPDVHAGIGQRPDGERRRHQRPGEAAAQGIHRQGPANQQDHHDGGVGGAQRIRQRPVHQRHQQVEQERVQIGQRIAPLEQVGPAIPAPVRQGVADQAHPQQQHLVIGAVDRLVRLQQDRLEDVVGQPDQQQDDQRPLQPRGPAADARVVSGRPPGGPQRGRRQERRRQLQHRFQRSEQPGQDGECQSQQQPGPQGHPGGIVAAPARCRGHARRQRPPQRTESKGWLHGGSRRRRGRLQTRNVTGRVRTRAPDRNQPTGLTGRGEQARGRDTGWRGRGRQRSAPACAGSPGRGEAR